MPNPNFRIVERTIDWGPSQLPRTVLALVPADTPKNKVAEDAIIFGTGCHSFPVFNDNDNGLIAGPYVFDRLLLLERNSEKIRTMAGMMKQTYDWTTQPMGVRCLKKRPEYLKREMRCLFKNCSSKKGVTAYLKLWGLLKESGSAEKCNLEKERAAEEEKMVTCLAPVVKLAFYDCPSCTSIMQWERGARTIATMEELIKKLYKNAFQRLGGMPYGKAVTRLPLLPDQEPPAGTAWPLAGTPGRSMLLLVEIVKTINSHLWENLEEFQRRICFADRLEENFFPYATTNDTNEAEFLTSVTAYCLWLLAEWKSGLDRIKQ